MVQYYLSFFSSEVSLQVQFPGTINDAALDKDLSPYIVKHNTLQKDLVSVRFSIGRVLVKHLGNKSGKPLQYGAYKVEELAEKLNTSTTAVYNMWYLGTRFKRIADFRKKYPDATTWSAVCEVLQNLRHGKGYKSRVAFKVRRHLNAATRLIEARGDNFTNFEKDKVAQSVEDLTDAVDRIGILTCVIHTPYRDDS